MTPAAYLREYRLRNPRDRGREALQKHVRYYRGLRHSCPRCSHPCPGKGCMTILHDPFQMLCSFCARTP